MALCDVSSAMWSYALTASTTSMVLILLTTINLQNLKNIYFYKFYIVYFHCLFCDDYEVHPLLKAEGEICSTRALFSES